jgi:hypothetical protein
VHISLRRRLPPGICDRLTCRLLALGSVFALTIPSSGLVLFGKFLHKSRCSSSTTVVEAPSTRRDPPNVCTPTTLFLRLPSREVHRHDVADSTQAPDVAVFTDDLKVLDSSWVCVWSAVMWRPILGLVEVEMRERVQRGHSGTNRKSRWYFDSLWRKMESSEEAAGGTASASSWWR